MTVTDETERLEIAQQAERWFVRHGIPHFIAGYSVRSDVFTRAAGFLFLVFVLELLNGLNLEWPWWGNALALVGSAFILFGGLALRNWSTGRLWYQRPDRIGSVELAAFVVLPAILPLIFGGQFRSAVVTVVANLLLLVVTYVVVGYGLVAMIRWALVQAFQQLRNLLNVLVRILPLLLLFTMFMFLNAELWDVVDEIPNAFFITAVSMLVGLGSLFLLLRLPRELGDVAQFDSWTDVGQMAEGTPVESVSLDGLSDPPDVPRSDRRARVNVGMLLYFAEGTQAFLVAAAIGGFYFVFGLFTMSEATIALWTAREPVDVVGTWSVFGHEAVVTTPLIRASIFVAAMAGLQFVVSALTDETYRREFAEDVYGHLRQVFAVRAVYLTRLASPQGPTDTST